MDPLLLPRGLIQDEGTVTAQDDPLVEDHISNDLPGSRDSPEPAQVVDMASYEFKMPDLSFTSLDDPEDPQARVEHVLSGEGYAEGQPPWELPICSRQQLGYDSRLLAPLMQGQLAEERAYVYEFSGTWWCMARATMKQGTGPTALDEECWILLTLMSMSIPMLARAMARRETKRQTEILEGMEAVLYGLFCMRNVDMDVRQKYT
ncbi:hypothetical protein K466DRAFT_603209 [Polyporus arcularius HHB13444]|uniref:Uncharacterized protein n=1 Tax=Polyporus arcularius HHB13444 TaxID=1314778 RepID=A0A5C3P082_9APHY|nr:hypothetical protein K466DRAFT_603209 [Polyporus arcularius HHB13444]